MSIERVFILHHTHVDIGYTGDRDEVCRQLVDMIDTALDAVKATATAPDLERFRWIHEVSWPVLEYLKRPDARAGELFDYIRRGDMELTALYLNPTDLSDAAMWELSIDRACALAKQHGLPLTSAMFSDCPGIAWSVADMLARRGVRYLSASPDFIMSMPLEVERPFYWEGPEGGRLLTWFSDWRQTWYAEGLTLGLAGDRQEGTNRLLEYIRQLETEGYRWKGLAIHLAMDNVPPRPDLVDFVRHFNGAQPGVRARLSTNQDFFSYMEQQHGPEFSVHRGAWPDWWANGNASAAYETSCSRRAKALLGRNAGLARHLGRPRDDERVSRAIEQILMFDEHTWGFNDSVRRPWSTASRVQWNKKRVLAGEALEAARDEERRLLQGAAGKGELVLLNPSDAGYAGPVSAPVGTVPVWTDESGAALQGQRGAKVPFPVDTSEMIFWADVPARTTRRFRAAGRRKSAAPFEGIESPFYRLVCDDATGGITDLQDKRLAGSLCDARAEWGLGELIHERVRNGNRELMYDLSKGITSPDSKCPCPEFVRVGGHRTARRILRTRGPVFNGIVTRGSVPGARFVREVRLYHGGPRVDVVLHIEKQVVTPYESLYVAFPFAGAGSAVFVENAGAVYRPGVEQLPGSATDWHSLGDYVAVSDGRRTIVLVPHDAPVVQVGGIHTGKWQKRLAVGNGHVYSWIMNNMWFTNFPAFQEGVVTLAYAMTTQAGAFDRAAARAFAAGVRQGVALAIGSVE